jgi:hypothetical protein
LPMQERDLMEQMSNGGAHRFQEQASEAARF